MTFKFELGGNVEISEWSKGRENVHKYWNIRKDVIKRILSYAKEPSFETVKKLLDEDSAKERNEIIRSDWWVD